MSNIDKVIDGILEAEKGYTNDSSDLGGETNWGITAVVARANGYHGNMKEMPVVVARQIYLNRYWLEPHFDQIDILSPAVAAELCDTAVNCGVNFAKPLIQEALNLLNREQADYADVPTDGIIGKQTLSALAAFLAKRGKDGEAVLMKTLNIMQGARYIEITKTRPANENFFYGWIKNRVT